ncbi:MAG TPA: hypothetical protein VEC14_07815 [Reyranellaceae bacterium]|nr:hypothetical protein [Reyranellaceae bacterium]
MSKKEWTEAECAAEPGLASFMIDWYRRRIADLEAQRNNDAEEWNNVDAALDRLGGLYTEETGDWMLEVGHTLTEPTCPSARIAPEGNNSTRYMAIGDTIREAILTAANMCHAEQVLKKRLPDGAGVPFTNPDDHNGSIPLPRK